MKMTGNGKNMYAKFHHNLRLHSSMGVSFHGMTELPPIMTVTWATNRQLEGPKMDLVKDSTCRSISYSKTIKRALYITW
jgi:hypothetical protein